MQAEMKAVEVQLEIFPRWDIDTKTYEIDRVYIITPEFDILPNVKEWIEAHEPQAFYLTKEERTTMEHIILRTVQYEVEVMYHKGHDGKKKVKTATCQNVHLPNFVKAWVELQAKNDVEKEPYDTANTNQ